MGLQEAGKARGGVLWTSLLLSTDCNIASLCMLSICGCGRTYETIKARLEAEEAAAQEEQRLVDLLRAEEVAAAARREAAERAARQAQLRATMMADNQAQLRYKVGQSHDLHT